MILRIYIHVTSMNLNTYSIQDHYVVYGVNTDFISLFMLLFTMLLHAAGCMFYGKPLYIAFAQRKEDRKTQLKLHYAPQQARLNGSPATVIQMLLHMCFNLGFCINLWDWDQDGGLMTLRLLLDHFNHHRFLL